MMEHIANDGRREPGQLLNRPGNERRDWLRRLLSGFANLRRRYWRAFARTAENDSANRYYDSIRRCR